MSPRTADPTVRAALVAAAARILAADGPRALTTRRLAAEAGATTMAVYTHFGSMDEVRKVVRQEAFAQLAAAQEALAATSDPVADLTAAALAYFDNGLTYPELYRTMFVDQPPEGEDAGETAFRHLLAAVTRCIDSGRFDRTDPAAQPMWAAELWTAQHGMVTLALAGLLPAEQIRAVLIDMTYRLCVGFGDEPAAARRSVELGSHAH